jgi:hypothetical protein
VGVSRRPAGGSSDRIPMRDRIHLGPLADIHRTSNLQNQGAWERFTDHRLRVTKLVLDLTPHGGRICVLGAGNINDLDLRACLQRASAVHLVDLDASALEAGLRRQHLSGDPRIVIDAPVDLSGVLHLLPEPGNSRGGNSLETLIAALNRHDRLLEADRFDVVVSAGVLTQLCQSVVESALENQHSVKVRVRLRDKHLRDMVSLAWPDGAALLVTDVVPTSTAPQLLNMPEQELEGAMAEAVGDHNFFTGTNPYRISAVLEEDAWFYWRVHRVRMHDPWLWAVTEDRKHLTCATSWRCAPHAPASDRSQGMPQLRVL